jgi:hypothetical protein
VKGDRYLTLLSFDMMYNKTACNILIDFHPQTLQVREEYTEHGGILQSDSPCYKLKRRVAMLVGHSMCEVGSFVAEDIEARNGDSGTAHEADGGDDSHWSMDPNSSTYVQGPGNRSHKKLYHCAGFPLWRARATEELSRGSTSAATSRPLYGVLVCLRPITCLEFRPSESTPLQFLCMMVAERVVEIRKKAHKIGESFVRRTAEQARKDLDDKHGGDVGRCYLLNEGNLELYCIDIDSFSFLNCDSYDMLPSTDNLGAGLS